jgi:hypothetical protein
MGYEEEVLAYAANMPGSPTVPAISGKYAESRIPVRLRGVGGFFNKRQRDMIAGPVAYIF